MRKGFFAESDRVREIPIKDGTDKFLRLKKSGSITPKGRPQERERFDIGRVIWGQQSTNPDIVILIEELIWMDGKRELRFGYWTTTHEKKKWWWGQSALITPIDDIQELIRFAEGKNLMPQKG